MGYVDHVRSALHQIDALIVPSTLDGRPNIIMEANACGVPVIGSPVGGIPELIVEGENGHVIDPKNINKMAEVLGAWLSDPAHFARMRQQARQMAERKFDRRFMLDAYAGAVEHFLGIPSAPAYGPPESGLSRSLRRS
jgi:glycosyltransferase involved in cell wall biosynthesis